jgi:UDP-glucose-4-epimerase GalE
VTGGAGYVGSHAAAELARAGREVVVLDDLSSGRREDARFGDLVVGDAGDEALVGRLCRDRGVVAVLHFAGRISVEESVRDPAGYRRANVGTTERLARAARSAGVAGVVFSSSAAVYGTPREVPIPEGHALRPDSPYGESKVEAERALARSGLPVVSLRYFNAAGADVASGLCERHDPETHLIPRALAAATGGAPLVVHGRDWPTEDGTCVRDYVHVVDLADAHVRALRLLESRSTGGTWNLGTGRGHTVLQVIRAVEDATGRRVERTDGPRRAGDAARLVADASRARDDLGWRPTRSSLDRIVSDAWEAHRAAFAST